MTTEQLEKQAVANAWARDPVGFERMCFATIAAFAEEESVALNVAAGIFEERLPLFVQILNTIHFLPKETSE